MFQANKAPKYPPMLVFVPSISEKPLFFKGYLLFVDILPRQLGAFANNNVHHDVFLTANQAEFCI